MSLDTHLILFWKVRMQIFAFAITEPYAAAMDGREEILTQMGSEAFFFLLF